MSVTVLSPTLDKFILTFYTFPYAIARYRARARAVQCAPEQIIITNGTQQALDLVMRLLINPGDGIAVEEPGYLSARRIFLSHQAELFPVPVDESGLMVKKLASLPSESMRLVYVTPSHQFPTGSILSLSRRLELLAWKQQHHCLILEDDYDSEHRYGGRPMPALQGLDQNHSMLYMGTFSKVLFPSLRLGYLVVPPPLVPLFAQAKWLSDRQLPLYSNNMCLQNLLKLVISIATCATCDRTTINSAKRWYKR